MISAMVALVFSGTASAQFGPRRIPASENTLKNGFVETPECPLHYEDWYINEDGSVPMPRYITAYGQGKTSYAILTWYYGGALATLQNEDARVHLYNCIKAGECGLDKNRKIAKLFEKKWPLSKKNWDTLYNYFEQTPPDAAIREATLGIGRCFGDHPAQPTMEEAGFTQVDLTPETCQMVMTQTRNKTGSRFEAFEAYYNPNTSCGPGIWIPTKMAEALGPMIEREREKQLAEARYAARPVEQRIAGLNGCQIAYGLIMGGLNNSSVSRVPDEGISWAFKYEKARINDDACPLIPASLSTWIQAQPLETFEPAADPFEFYRNNMPPKTAYDRWPDYVRTVMKHYETPTNPHKAVPANACSAFGTWLDKEKFNNSSEQRPDWRFLFDARKYSGDPQRSICVQAPVSMILKFQRDEQIAAQQRIIEEAQWRQEEAARNAAQMRFNELLRWKPSYQPPAAEPRCYRRDDTSEICFFD